MCAKHKKDEEAIFNAAIQIESLEERNAYLAEACGEDKKLRADVEALLKAHYEAGKSFLKAPPVGIDSTLGAPPLTEGPGTRIGRYKLLQLIGEGGFGVVYMAEQEKPIRRRVALKIIKLGMDTKQVIARFEAERQALAMMDHANIARVFDAGATDTGRPYFVMELVKGIPITEYCDKNNLDTQQRLDLFIDVCKAVQHAHQKGIIHRDIKPSNVMITLHDGKPVPKIIDFGIAKATQQRLTEKTFFTEFKQFIGTPEYMSPEQAEMTGLDVDTRSDIYSLGVLLYELLTGTTPFEAEQLRSAAYDEIRRIIREDEPPKPSTRLNTLGEALSDVAKHRHVQPGELCKIVRGDLDWVVMKSLEKDRTRRYETANEFAMDIERHLGDEPVVASPPSVGYRLSKFVRRNRAPVTAAVAVAAALLIGLMVSTAMYFRAEALRVGAEQAREKEAIARAQAEQAEKVAKEKSEELRRSLYVNSIQLADAKYREGNVSLVRELLESCPNDLRGWEWDRLNYIRDESIMTLSGTSGESIRPVIGKDDCIYAAILNPDGKRIVSGHLDGTIRVWDSVTGEKLKEFRAHDQPLWSMAASFDGQFVVSGSFDKTIKVWDTETFEESKTLRGHKGRIFCIAVSRNTELIASLARGEKVLRVWDVQTGSELMTLGDRKSDVEHVTFSPDGKHIISGDNAGDVKIWDVTNREMLTAIHAHPDSVRRVAVNSDGSQIASAGATDNVIKVWDTKTGVQLASFHVGQEHGVESLAFSPDGKYIAYGRRNQINIWEIETGSELRTLRGHAGWLTSLAFSHDGKRIISSGWAGTVKLWDVSSDHEATRLIVDHGLLDSISIAFSPDGKRIASNTDGMVKIWDVDSCTELITLHKPTAGGQGGSIVFSSDGRLIGASIPGGTIKVWDASTSVEVMTLQVPGQRVENLTFSPDNKRIAGTSVIPDRPRGVIKMWDLSNGKEIMAPSLEKLLMPTSVAFSPDGKYLISGLFVVPNLQGGEVKQRGAVKVWDVSNGTEVITMIGQDGPVFCVAFSPDGKLIATGTHICTANVWDATTGAELVTLNGHEGAVYSVAFSPDGKRIISGSTAEHTIKVWDAESGAEVLTLLGDGPVFGVAFSSDGKRIISGSFAGTVKVWDVETGTELMTLPRDDYGFSSVAFSPDGKTIAAGTYDSSIKLWESTTPAGGYEPRKTAEAARKVVDELYKETGFYSEVIDKLKADKTLAEPVRKVALQIANSRLWEDAEKLKKQSGESAGPEEVAGDQETKTR